MDVRELARRRLPHPIFEFLDGGSETEVTLRRNTAAFDEFQLIAKCLVNVESIDTATRILGQSTALPLVCAPTGASRVFHPEGELAIARAAARAGVLYGLATASTFSLEDVAAASNGAKMFLLYPYKDRSIMWELMERARGAGYSSLCLMVDVPVKGKRERDLRNGFNMAPSLSLALSAMRRPAWALGQLRSGPITLANFSKAGAGAISELDASITWKDIGEIVHRWAGPFAFKGIMSAEDAVRAADAGATAIFVSNHGGRQLDGAAAPLIFITEENIASTRSWVDSFNGTFHPDVPVVERRVPGVKRIPDVRIYLINARSGEHRPGILATHAGGYIVGSARADVPILQRIAAALDCVIVAVDYRLAPEARYCDSLEDNYLALKWTYDNAAEIGLDPSRIAVMGASAGGGHAALLAIAARDRGEVSLAFQLLVYPMLDDRTCTSRQIPEHIGSLLWTMESNRVGWRAFLGCEPGTSEVPAGAVPARTPDLSGLPPAFIGVGALDLFVGECIEYARRLICAGVQTELHIVPGAFHGFDFAEDAVVAKQFRAAKIQALGRAFGVALKPEADPQLL